MGIVQRSMAMLGLSLLLFSTGMIFRFHGLEAAIPTVRTLMPVPAQDLSADSPLARQALDPRADRGWRFSRLARREDDIPTRTLNRARSLCRNSDGTKFGTQVDYCVFLAGAGDPAAQAVVAQFYLDGSTPASKAQAYAWLRTASRNTVDGGIATAARERLKDVMGELDPAALDRAEKLAVKYIRKYAR